MSNLVISISPESQNTERDMTNLCFELLKEAGIKIPQKLSPSDRLCLLKNKDHRIVMFVDFYDKKTNQPMYNFSLKKYFSPNDRYGVSYECAPFSIIYC